MTTTDNALYAGVSKVEITDTEAGAWNDPLFVKALVLRQGDHTAVMVTIDAVAIAEIGHIPNDYLDNVRSEISEEFSFNPDHVVINASHCHGMVRKDVDQLTIKAIRQAQRHMTRVRVGVGTGHEDRIMENRRLKLKHNSEGDVRHAYPMPPDDQVIGVGPIDPQIGVLRLDREDDGRTLAVVYHFAIHPIQTVPSRANTADITGFASQVIEDNLDGAVAMFLQGCGGDINPVQYKDVDNPRDAEPLGNMLGLSTLKALRRITCV